MSWENFLGALSNHPITSIILGFWIIVLIFAIKKTGEK